MKRNIGQELLDGIEAIKTGGGVRHRVELPDTTKTIRDKTGLSQSANAYSVESEGEQSYTMEEVFPELAGKEKQVYLKGIRYREDLTQKQLADLAGIPQRHISEMENGKRPIGKENAKKLAKALNADYRMLL